MSNCYSSALPALAARYLRPASSCLAAMILALVPACVSRDSAAASKPAPAIPPPVARAQAPAAASKTTADAESSTSQSEPTPLPKGASAAPAPFEGEGWEDLFDGQSLDGWRVVQFAGGGEVQVHSGVIVMNMGEPFTGVAYTNKTPTMNYEVALDAMRVTGSDFFCGLTVPVGENHCSLIVGGWGGSLLGISSLDGMDASENETSKFISFETGKWYRLRLRITANRIEGWVDQEKYIDVDTEGRRISVRPGDIELCKPFGIACWQTTAAIREVKIRKVEGAADRRKKPI